MENYTPILKFSHLNIGGKQKLHSLVENVNFFRVKLIIGLEIPDENKYFEWKNFHMKLMIWVIVFLTEKRCKECNKQ